MSSEWSLFGFPHLNPICVPLLPPCVPHARPISSDLIWSQNIKYSLELQLICSCTLSLTSALNGSGWSTPRPGCFNAGKEPCLLWRPVWLLKSLRSPALILLLLTALLPHLLWLLQLPKAPTFTSYYAYTNAPEVLFCAEGPVRVGITLLPIQKVKGSTSVGIASILSKRPSWLSLMPA